MLLTELRRRNQETATTPTKRQAEFLQLDCEEAFFGGAVGGAKSYCLLLWLAEGIPYEGYSGIVFRRTYPQLAKSGDSLIAKSFQIYHGLGGKWNGTDRQWRFPSGAVIEMGHLTHETTVYDYQGAAYQRAAFDELPQFSETQYLYLFSRLRRPVGFPIKPGVRGAGNPGGSGHIWTKKRFVTNEAIKAVLDLGLREPTPPGYSFATPEGRVFFPSRLIDNPYLDIDDYEQKLMHLDPLTRARLMKGDWSISEDGLIKPDYLRSFYDNGAQYELADSQGRIWRAVYPRECSRFFTIDPAGTSKERARETKGKPPSHSVISVFDHLNQGNHLFTLDVWRQRVTTPELCRAVEALHRKYKPAWIGCENVGIGLAVYSELLDRGFPMRALDPGGQDKATRAAAMLNMMAEGRFWVRKGAPWLDEVETELLAWTGHPDEPFDVGDTFAYAARYCGADRGPVKVGGAYLGRRL